MRLLLMNKEERIERFWKELRNSYAVDWNNQLIAPFFHEEDGEQVFSAHNDRSFEIKKSDIVDVEFRYRGAKVTLDRVILHNTVSVIFLEAKWIDD
jgi:hypothetical protein